jgi:hypothetical protein
MFLTQGGKHLPQHWHMPLEDSLERIKMFLMGLSIGSWERPYRAKVHERSEPSMNIVGLKGGVTKRIGKSQ